MYYYEYTRFENATSSKNGYTDEIVAFTATKFPNDDDVRTFKENGISPSSLKVAAHHTYFERVSCTDAQIFGSWRNKSFAHRIL